MCVLDSARHPFAVIANADPARARLGAFTAPRDAMALLTHDRGHAWPDSRGEQIALQTIEAGGTAVFCFGALGDAIACLHRLRGGAA